MKFSISDITDQHLTTSIAHEYLKCRDCFNLFVQNESLKIKINTKEIRIRSYNLYSDFLLHLYEFYVGCFKRDRKSTEEIHWVALDKLFTSEAQKLIDNSADRIRNGRAPTWENDISYYQVSVPDEFGMHFRRIRNRHGHVDYKRASGEEITLSEFFRKCHKFIYILYSTPAWIWQVNDIENYDFRSIEEFEIAIIEANPQNNYTHQPHKAHKICL